MFSKVLTNHTEMTQEGLIVKMKVLHSFKEDQEEVEGLKDPMGTRR